MKPVLTIEGCCAFEGSVREIALGDFASAARRFLYSSVFDRGHGVNGNKLLPLAFLALAALAAGACRKQAAVTAPATQTIAPAAAQPAPTTGTDQMTGTVEVEDGRSEAEGGVLMDNHKSQTSTTGTPKKTTTKTAPKKTKSKK
jgi:hypothetical protein